MRVRTGLEGLLSRPPRWLGKARIGLLCNQASVDFRLRHARRLFAKEFGSGLTALFSPQHGFQGDKQDNMVESPHGRDRELDIPVFSLYGDVRRPTEEMFSGIDVLVVDLQEAGCRVYTFITTLYYCLEEAARLGKKVVVLDRPNPVGGAMEGHILLPEMTSFVGVYPLPLRHGLTMGELASIFNTGADIGADLKVVPMGGWRRSMFFEDTGLPWVPPSPNLPTPDSAVVYPGQVLLEGTNLSEGRGTTRPFELCGSPFIDAVCLSARSPGPVTVSPVWSLSARPFSSRQHQKWAGRGLRRTPASRHEEAPQLPPRPHNPRAPAGGDSPVAGEQFAWKRPPLRI